MGKLIAIYGEAGAGKTTTAVNLACSLSKNNYTVSLVSANIEYGELQVFFNVFVDREHGVFAALNDQSDQQQNRLALSGYQNLFILTVPNDGPDELGLTLGAVSIENVLNRIQLSSDFLIVDCKDDLCNEITLMALYRSDNVICVHKPDNTGILWYSAHKDTLLSFDVTHIINDNIMFMEPDSFSREIGRKIDYYLPNVPFASTLKNSGAPIYYDKSKASAKYAMEIDKLSTSMQGGYYG